MLNFNQCCSVISALAVSTFLPNLVIAGAMDDGEDSVAPHDEGDSGAAPHEGADWVHLPKDGGKDDTTSQYREEENVVPLQDEMTRSSCRQRSRFCPEGCPPVWMDGQFICTGTSTVIGVCRHQMLSVDGSTSESKRLRTLSQCLCDHQER